MIQFSSRPAKIIIEQFKSYLDKHVNELSKMPDLLGYLAFGVVKDPFSNPIFSKLLTRKWSDELGRQLEVFLTTMLPSDAEPSLLQMYKHWIGNVSKKPNQRPHHNLSVNGSSTNSFSKPTGESSNRRPLKLANPNISFDVGGVSPGTLSLPRCSQEG